MVIELEIDDIVMGGEGIAKHNGFPIFVPMSVPKDIVKARIISTKKSYARALITEIIKKSPDRVNNNITFEDNGGLDFGMMSYEAQLKYKKNITKNVLSKIGGLNIQVNDTLASPQEFNYRNKVIEPFALKDGKIITGFYKKKSHEVFEVSENVLNSKLSNSIIKRLKELLNEKKISVYDEKTHKGILRSVMVRTNSQNQTMVVLVINSQKVNKFCEDILLKLAKENKNIISCYISLNSEKTNVAIGKKNICVYGEKNLVEELFGIKFNISPTSFFQINYNQTKNLYSLAISQFKDIKNKKIIDAYSGTGTLAMILKDANKVYAIESVKSATYDATRGAKLNNIQNISFINGKVEDTIPKLLDEKIDSIIFDPPRKGIEESVLQSVAQNNIKEIVYISCNPATFARDAKILTNLGYKIDEATPVDMFPQTSHIEVVGKFYK